MTRRFLTTTALAVVLISPAFAADLGHPVYKAPPPAPPPVQDWSGIYVGLEAGYGWGKQNNTNFDPFFSNFFSEEFCEEAVDITGVGCSGLGIGSVSQSGWLAGGFVGAQKQWGSWVLGIEADFDGADIKGSQTAARSVSFTPPTSTTSSIHSQHTLNTKIDELGTLRGKVGWAWSPNWLIYGTGGLAWAHVRDDFSASQTACVDGTCAPFFAVDEITDTFIGGVSSSAGVTMLGWTVGAGLEYKWQIDPGSAVIFGVEYLHYQFPEHSLAFGGPLLPGGAIEQQSTFTIGNMQETVDVIKGRISYFFSIH
jgi:outer membrane immunogenic protein